MFTVRPDNTLVGHCEKLVKAYDFGKRHTANGTQEQQLTGMIGQSVVMDGFGLGYASGSNGFDDGVDLVFEGIKIDVKTMGRSTDVRRNYTNNFLKLQDYFDTDVYIFCSYHKVKKEVTVCGWISKPDFVAKRRFYPKGSTRKRLDGSTFDTFSDLYEIDNCHLNDIESFEDLKRQLRAFWK
ncbi:MAG TPA: hypothetical protein PKI08_04940 [Aquaticitalea sp.]|nr:hypothetical protein [Aquaticitalea sp.]